MHGLGNDYIVVDELDGPTGAEPASLARAACDRHFGVGADGVLWLGPAGSAPADFRLTVRNPDGSDGGMCGNGARCAFRYLFERGRIGREAVAWIGERRVRMVGSFDGDRLESVRVDLGLPGIAPREIPVELGGRRVVDHPIELPCGPGADAETVRVTCVSVGNPHCVLFVEDVGACRLDVLGPRLEGHPLFPERCNVEVVERRGSSRLCQRTWERGSGETLACGSGAAATAVACGLRFDERGPFEIELRGGTLRAGRGAGGGVWIEGPAVEVFRGVWLGRVPAEGGPFGA